MERTLSHNEVFWDYFLVIFQIMMAYKSKILYPAANGRLVFTIAIVYTVHKKPTNQKGRMKSLQRPVTEVVFRNISALSSRFTTALDRCGFIIKLIILTKHHHYQQNPLHINIHDLLSGR